MIYDSYIAARNGITHFTYSKMFKPMFFRQDPEEVHDKMLKLGNKTSNNPVTGQAIKLAFNYQNKSLQQTVDGVDYRNPIGLAAGFDKNAQLTKLMSQLGFGFEEIGSVTGESCPGNDGTRLWRLPKSKSLVVYYGLMSDGAEKMAEKLKDESFDFPIGVSIAKTNSPNTVDMNEGVKDYIKAYDNMRNVGDYVTINISCPNAYGGQPFTDKKSLGALLDAIDEMRADKPHYIKMSPDLSNKQLDDIIELGAKHKINGFITSNLTKNRNNKKIIEKELPENGGLSGKVVQDLADKQLSYIHKKTDGKFTLIGCGGVFTAEDAYHKILHGASLVQMITGMIYEGPQVIGEINRGLVKLLKHDGYESIQQAVGKAIK